MFNFRSINQVRGQTPFAPPVIFIQGDMSIHDFDREMVNVSIRLAQDLMVDRLVENIIVSMNKNVYATIKN